MSRTQVQTATLAVNPSVLATSATVCSIAAELLREVRAEHGYGL